MGARDILKQLERMNIRLSAEGDRLVIRPAGVLPSDLRQQLIELKPALLRIAPRRRWRVTPPGRPQFVVDCVVAPVTPDEIRAQWPGALVEPMS